MWRCWSRASNREGEVVAIDLAGHSEVIAHVESLPLYTAWLPDGRLVIVSSPNGRLLRREPDGSLVTHADLGQPGWNYIVVDGRGNAYVNRGGFNPMAGEAFKPGLVALVTADGSVRQVADDIAFPNGMAVTPDNSTLIVADSYRHSLVAFDIGADGGLSNRRVWAELGEGTPDGICLDAQGAVWYADVPNQRCVCVAEGGTVLQTVRLDRGCFACALGGPTGRRCSWWPPNGGACPRWCRRAPVGCSPLKSMCRGGLALMPAPGHRTATAGSSPGFLRHPAATMKFTLPMQQCRGLAPPNGAPRNAPW